MNLFISIVLLLTIPNIAYAYLDPISISYFATLLFSFIAIIFNKIKKFYLYWNYDDKFHLINILFIISPLLQFISINIYNNDLIFYSFLLILNIIFILFYYLFYRFVKNFFPSKYKNIILITLILFFFQFQFSDLYLLSLETNIRLRIIVLVFLIIFFIIFLVRKNFLKNFLSNLILIFSIFFIFKYVYGLYLNFSQIKNLNAEYKSEQSENLIKQTHINKNKNVYFIISDAVIDLDLFEKVL